MNHKFNTEETESILKVNGKKEDQGNLQHLIKSYRVSVSDLHRRASNLKIPVIIIFEGINGAGKGSLVNELTINLDPRLINFYATHKPTREEKLRPFLWSYWNNQPLRGKTAILYRSWYSRLIYYNLNKEIKEKEPRFKEIIEEINSFEKMLIDEGYVIIKFFLHIDKDTQKEAINRLKKNPLMSWKSEEYEEVDYNKYNKIIKKLMECTDKHYAPWHNICSEDKSEATLEIYKVIEDTLKNAINKTNKNIESPLTESHSSVAITMEESKEIEEDKKENKKDSFQLANVELSKTLSQEEYKEKIKPLQKRLRELQYTIYEKRISLIILYEGWDAAGKGGNIKRLIKELDPTGYEVIPIGTPTAYERDHHYLWRFWTRLPKNGHIAIFDRSWYGRVLVERVEGFIDIGQCDRSYKEINNMEKSLANSKTILVKLFIHIDKEEQLKRFKAREENPQKDWKITEEDYRNREKWEDYVLAIEQMVNNTSTDYAPWKLIEGNCKRYGRIKALESVINTVEDKLKHYEK